MDDEQIRLEHHELLFAARRAVRYHMYRQRFLDRISNWGTLMTAIVGSATFATLLANNHEYSKYAAAATAVFSAFEVVFRPGRVARQHNELARECIALEQEALRVASAKMTAESIVALQTRRLDIEAKEPPVYRVLDAICHDELVRALGYSQEHQSNVMGIQRLFKNIVDRASQLLLVNPAMDFKDKLDSLGSDGRISHDEERILQVLVDAGSAAAHRGWRPKAEELSTMVDVIESFLHRSFVLGDGIAKLKASVPARPKRA